MSNIVLEMLAHLKTVIGREMSKMYPFTFYNIFTLKLTL